MEFTTYIRNPFIVEAVEITDDNIEEVATFVGKVKVDEPTGRVYIALDRRIVPNVGRAYVGWWLTRLGENFRCYAPKVFTEQFSQSTGMTFSEDTEGGHEESDPAPANGMNRPEINNVFSDEAKEEALVAITDNVSVLETGKFDVV